MSSSEVAELQELVAQSGIRRVRVVSWRDLDDPEAGGSELHAAEVLKRWAAAGLEITHRTSAVHGLPRNTQRDGYSVIRKDGRYSVFPRVMREGMKHGRRDFDAVVEIWNGMPFLTPLWFRGPRSVWLHHVHGEMWQMTLPGVLGRIGWTIEHRLAPMFYRRSTIATLSRSSEEEIHERLHLRRTEVIPPGISEFYSPTGSKSATPLVVAVGRLVPVKRFDLLIRQFAAVRDRIPNATLIIVGEGYMRGDLEALINELGVQEAISLVGHVTDDALRELYRSAWVVASASLREGWGMSLTEAAACGTPVVASDIAGHRDAVASGRSGLLVPDNEIANALSNVLNDVALRAKLSDGALSFAAELSWDSTALRLFRLFQAR